jgi:hypothetical protein
MKTIIYILAVFTFFTIGKASAEEGEENYGLTVSQSYHANDKSVRHNINMMFEYDRKVIQFGALLKNDKFISGADIKYKYYLSKDYDEFSAYYSGGKNVRPYFTYHFVFYRHESMQQEIPGLKKKSGFENPMPPVYGEGMVTTLEHYLGLGLQMKLFPRIYVDGSVCAGAYMGKTDYEGSVIEYLGINSFNSGFSVALNIGIGYVF